MNGWTIYHIGPMSSAAQKAHNLRLEALLRTHGWLVVSPQETTLKHRSSPEVDHVSINKEYIEHSTSQKTIVLACVDGDIDSTATSLIIGHAANSHGRILCYKKEERAFSSDFHASGVNALVGSMCRSVFVHPCPCRSEREFDEYYSILASFIHRFAVDIAMEEVIGA